MKRFAITATALVLAWSGLAHAGTAYTASLSLPDGLPRLRTGVASMDGGGTFAGVWTTPSDPRTKGFVRDRDGTGPDAPWKDWVGNMDMHRSTGVPNTMGESLGHAAGTGSIATARGDVRHTQIRVNGTTAVVGDSEIDAFGSWTRGFQLEAFESFTFTALSAIGIEGDDVPVDSLTMFAFDPVGSFASLTMTDKAGRVRTRLTASISSAFPADWTKVFRYSSGADGLLSLTITNPTADRMTGTLGAGAFIHVTSPVPRSVPVALPAIDARAVAAAERGRRLAN